MNDPSQFLLAPYNNSDGDGDERPPRRSARRTVLLLYRNSTVWRGAVDMACLGLLVMGVSVLFPFSFHRAAGPGVSPPPAAAAAIAPAPASPAVPPASVPATPPPATRPAAQLSPALGPASGELTLRPPPRWPPPAEVTRHRAQLPPGFAAPRGEAISRNPSFPAAGQGSIPGLPVNNVDRPDHTLVGAVSPQDSEFFNRAIDLAVFDSRQAESLAAPRANAGDVNAQYVMGLANYADAIRSNSDAAGQEAKRWLELAAGQGHPAAQFLLGRIYRRGLFGTPADAGQAVQWLQKGADNPYDQRGDAAAELSDMYREGSGLPQDMLERKILLERAAQKGNAGAQSSLGVMEFEGKDTPRDLAQAQYWLQKSADQGFPLGELNLALLYKMGALSQPDYAQFLKWMTLAAEQNVGPAYSALGDFYREGAPGYPPDLMRAATYYRQGALKKDPKSQYYLAEMYENGAGMPRDPVQAYVYYTLSYRNGGFGPALSALQSLQATMTPDQLANADRFAQALHEELP